MKDNHACNLSTESCNNTLSPHSCEECSTLMVLTHRQNIAQETHLEPIGHRYFGCILPSPRVLRSACRSQSVHKAIGSN